MDLEQMRTLCYSSLDSAGFTKVSYEAINQARSLLRESDSTNQSDSRFMGPWGFNFPIYYEIFGGFVQEKKNYITIYHESDEGLGRIANFLELPVGVKYAEKVS